MEICIVNNYAVLINMYVVVVVVVVDFYFSLNVQKGYFFLAAFSWIVVLTIYFPFGIKRRPLFCSYFIVL